jgi:hypothetical protein
MGATVSRSSKIPEVDQSYVEDSRGVKRTKRPRRKRDANKKEVSRLREWYIISLPRRDYIHLLAHGAESFLRSRQLCSYSRTSQHFMEPEGSAPCLQEPLLLLILSQSIPPHPIKDQFYYCPRTYVLVFLVVTFLLTFSPITFMHSSSPPFVQMVLPFSSSLS